MPIINQRQLNQLEENNPNSIGKAIVTIAKRVMNLLDEDPTPLTNGYYPNLHTAHGLIQKATTDLEEDGLSGLMASYLINIVYTCHSRGKEFVDSYNNKIKEKESEG